VSELPPCGLYRVVKPIAEIPAGRLVYFHNHGDPGAGVYFPERWNSNRAQFSPRGTTLPTTWDTRALKPLPVEGFYRVSRAFFCCEKKCVRFEPDQFVQLGYNGAGQGLLFQPEVTTAGISVPERGSLVDDTAFDSLVKLTIAERQQRDDLSLPRGIVVH
jgi:hypothetical protein